jgi:hypothetical protein
MLILTIFKDSNSMDQRRPGGMGIPGPGFAPPNMAMSNIPYVSNFINIII